MINPAIFPLLPHTVRILEKLGAHPEFSLIIQTLKRKKEGWEFPP
jgi:hypothetical protein